MRKLEPIRLISTGVIINDNFINNNDAEGGSEKTFVGIQTDRKLRWCK